MKNPRSITSLKHPLVKHLIKLRNESSYRYENQTLLLEGLKPILELSPFLARVLYTLPYASYVESIDAEKWEVTQAIVNKISGMTSPEGVLAEVSMPLFIPLDKTRCTLALDGINDPGNLGTLLRTALAFGWEAVYFLPGTCDPFNEKTLRAARGAHFKLSLGMGTANQLKSWAEKENVQALVADLKGTFPQDIPAASQRLLVLGNEAHGASTYIKQFCQAVTIPMSGKMESLNVAIAGGILLYLFSNKESYERK